MICYCRVRLINEISLAECIESSERQGLQRYWKKILRELMTFAFFWISRHLKRLIIVFFLRLWVQGLRTPEKRAYFWTRVKNQIPILRDGGDGGGGGGGEVSNQGKVLLKCLIHGWRYSMTMINFVSYREVRIYFFN